MLIQAVRMVLIAATLLVPGLASAVFENEVDLSGSWALNRTESELPDGPLGRRLSAAEVTFTQTGDGLKMVSRDAEGYRRETGLKPGAGPQSIATFEGDIVIESHWDAGKLIVRRLEDRETRGGDLLTIELLIAIGLSEGGGQLFMKLDRKTAESSVTARLVFDKMD